MDMQKGTKKQEKQPSAGQQAQEEDAKVAIERYRDLAEGIDHGIVWEANAALQFCMVSRRAERMTGYSLDEWCEPDFWKKHLHPEDRDRVMDKFQKALDGTDEHSDHRFVAADGHVIWFHTGIHAARNKGKIVYRGLSVDVTYLKETEEKLKQKTNQLEEANRVKSYFLSIASHEIRNALNAILGYASLLKEEGRIREAEKQREIYRHIYRNATNLLDLINQILDLDKIEAGQTDLRTEVTEISISEVVQQVLEDHKVLWEEKGLKVGLLDDPTGPNIYSDRVKLRQIFINLLTNAIKFTEKGSITVRIIHNPEAKKVSVAIKNTGYGISEEDLSHIFEPFYQSGRPGEEEGVGLGLPIVKKFVDTLKGTIDVKSEPGKGSTFAVTFPYEIS